MSESFHITAEEKAFILNLSHTVLENAFSGGKLPLPDCTRYLVLQERCGVFVSLYKNAKLRGCIGSFREDTILYDQVVEMTKASAFRDWRFDAVSVNEVEQIKIEISVLTPVEK